MIVIVGVVDDEGDGDDASDDVNGVVEGSGVDSIRFELIPKQIVEICISVINSLSIQ